LASRRDGDAAGCPAWDTIWWVLAEGALCSDASENALSTNMSPTTPPMVHPNSASVRRSFIVRVSGTNIPKRPYIEKVRIPARRFAKLVAVSARSGRTHQSTGLHCGQVASPFGANAVLKTANGSTRPPTENSIHGSLVITPMMQCLLDVPSVDVGHLVFGGHCGCRSCGW
jgi:hypothetical protein